MMEGLQKFLQPLFPRVATREQGPPNGVVPSAAPTVAPVEALKAISFIWATTAASEPPRKWSAEELARKLCELLRMGPDLQNCYVPSFWLRANYLLFCDWLQATAVPPFKDFARELARRVPRKRRDLRRGRARRGETYTGYMIVPPSGGALTA
jgi:hypothetical protein